MTSAQRIFATAAWAVLVLFMVGILVGSRWVPRREGEEPGVALVEPQQGRASELSVLYSAANFVLTDQNGKEFTDQQLLGSVYIVDLIFTNCAGPCPLMTQRMAELQTEIPDRRVRFVSLSVDPKRDTPEVLKKYAADFKADETRWTFLTGDSVYQVARRFLLTAQPAEEESPIIHAEQFLLVDGQGQVRGVYGFKNEEAMKRLPSDAMTLAAQLPAGQVQ